MPSTATILQYAPYACVLASNAAQKGNLFNGGAVDPTLPQKIYSVYVIAKKIYDIDPTYAGLDYVVSRLWELMRGYGLASQAGAGGGGSVAPATPISDIFPFIITSSAFQSDGISYNNPDIVGVALTIFINEVSQSWMTASPLTFQYTLVGIQVLVPGFDANLYDYTIMLQRLGTG